MNAADRPYYMTDEMYGRLCDIFDSHPPDLDYVADVVYREYPELDRRTAGLATVWGSKNLQAVSQ